jgi:hypothetical protein
VLSGRDSAAIAGLPPGGMVRADGHNRLPMVRMTNVGLLPGAGSLDEIIADTRDGILMSTNRSWSIDDRRLNFQFGCEIGWEIKKGKKGRMLRNPTYTGITPQFWGTMDRLAGVRMLLHAIAQEKPEAPDQILIAGDIVVGYLTSGAAHDAPLDTSDPTKFNAVQIRVRRTTEQNGKVPMFFARALGMDSVATEATATAMLQRNICGFRTPAEGEALAVLPFALDKQAWDNLVNNGEGADEFQWDSTGKQVTSYCDGIKEINLYPEGAGLQAARGTVEIGLSGSNMGDLKRRITDGITRTDVLDLGTPLELDANGRLYLNGTSGISEAVNSELASIVGKTRIIPIFDAAGSVGEDVTYTVVQWAGVRVMDADVTGSSSHKRLIVQPANVVSKHAKSKEGTQSSWFVYSPAWLVR